MRNDVFHKHSLVDIQLIKEDGTVKLIVGVLFILEGVVTRSPVSAMDTEPGFLSELSGMFSNRTEWHPLPMFEATPENCEAFRRWLDSQWAELPEALPTQTAAELVDHSPQRIHEWIREEVLVGIKLGIIQYCAKAEFIGFMASPQRLAHPCTEKYKDLVREFKYIQHRERENEQRRQKRKMMKEST